MVEGAAETTETTIPAEFEDLFDRKSFAVIGTTLPNGAMHMTVVWIDYDGSHLLVNSAMGRRKVKNSRHNPDVGLAVLDPETPYRYLWVAGTVTDIIEDGAESHAHSLARRYLGVDEYPYLEQDPARIMIKIRPDICHGYAARVLEDGEE